MQTEEPLDPSRNLPPRTHSIPTSLVKRIRRALPSAFEVAKLGFRLFGVPRNAFGSIDVTQKCNLRCKHCYFFEHEQPERALSVDEWVALLEGWKRTRSRWEFPFYQCSWVGGEPLLRPEVIARCRKFFRYNLVVTNGTLPLPDWPDVDFYVSVDKHLGGEGGGLVPFPQLPTATADCFQRSLGLRIVY